MNKKFLIISIISIGLIINVSVTNNSNEIIDGKSGVTEISCENCDEID